MAEVSRFAALMGKFTGKKAEEGKDDKNAKGEKPVQREDETDEDFEKRLKEWEDSGKEGKSAEQPKDTSDDDQDETEKLKKAETKGFADGVAAANTRWTDVLASTEAQGKVVTACDLLADTDLDAAAIKKALAKIQAPTGRSTLAQRQPTPTPAPAVDPAPDPAAQEGPKGFAARVQAAVAKVRPSKTDKAA